VGAAIAGACVLGDNNVVSAAGQDPQTVKNRYIPIDDKESFATVRDRMTAAKPEIIRFLLL
jgi:hypothetical protein